MHYVTFVDTARHLSQELCNALRHHVTQQQLDPSASYKKRLAYYFLYGHHGKGDEETVEDVVRTSEEEK